MSNLNITSPFSGGVTIIPNQFIEKYMAKANGEFVKIYLYLMYISENNKDLSLENIADALSCTEADVLRALKYWEKEGLLKSETAATEQPAPEQKATPLTADKVKQLKENESIAELLFIAQQYMGKPLSPTETNKILFFYEELHFSTDLIEYLIEYCVSKGHRSIHYIEKVAFAWKEDGVTDVESAKKSTNCYHKDYYTILKALGIRGRNPIDAEVAIMKTWINDYGFSLDIIVEACTRTILTTKQPSLQYADRILRSWKEANVHSMSDIQKLDMAHEQTKAEKPKTKTAKTTNRFTNFEQRSYDYEALERELLKR